MGVLVAAVRGEVACHVADDNEIALEARSAVA